MIDQIELQIRNDKIVELYVSGWHIYRIARSFGLSDSTVRRVLVSRATKMRPRGTRGLRGYKSFSLKAIARRENGKKGGRPRKDANKNPQPFDQGNV